MQLSRQMPKAREGYPRNHRGDARKSVPVTSNYMTNLRRQTCRQRAYDEGQFCTEVRGFLHIGECGHLASINKVTSPPKIVPGCSCSWHEVIYYSKWLIKDFALGKCYPVAH